MEVHHKDNGVFCNFGSETVKHLSVDGGTKIVEIHSASRAVPPKIHPLLKSWWHPEFSMSMFDLSHFFGVAHPVFFGPPGPITPEAWKTTKRRFPAAVPGTA